MTQVAGFGVKFQEAISFLKGKLPEASMAWDDLAGPVHAKVFTVAGSTSASLSSEIQASLVKALEQGTTISAFRKDFDQIVAKHGWSYNGSRGWRTSLIFDTNLRSASMAGRWAQIQANKANRPFLQYRTAGDSRVRPQHRLWNGIIRAVDDPFWSTHYPPNGWNCRCTVRAYAKWEIEDENLHVETTPYKTVYRDVANKDGVVDRVPVGIDPGWDHNVGQSWIQPELSLGAKLAHLPPELRGPVVDKTISPAFQQAIGDRFKAFRSGVKEVGNTGKAHVVGFLDSAVLDGMATQVPAVPLRTSAIAALDEVVPALEAGSWSAQMLDELPANLRNYQAVLWDTTSGALVIVPQGPRTGDLPIARLTPNVRSRFGHVLAVTELSTASHRDLSGNRYRVLVGKVGE